MVMCVCISYTVVSSSPYATQEEYVTVRVNVIQYLV